MYQQNESNNYNMNQNPNLNEQNQNVHAPNTQPANPAAQTGTMPNQNTQRLPASGGRRFITADRIPQKPSSGPSNNPQNPMNPQQPPKKQKSGAGAKVGLIVACMVLSLACGVGGSVATNFLLGSGKRIVRRLDDGGFNQSVENQTDPATTTVADVAARRCRIRWSRLRPKTVATDSYFWSVCHKRVRAAASSFRKTAISSPITMWVDGANRYQGDLEQRR